MPQNFITRNTSRSLAKSFYVSHIEHKISLKTFSSAIGEKLAFYTKLIKITNFLISFNLFITTKCAVHFNDFTICFFSLAIMKHEANIGDKTFFLLCSLQ